MPPQAGKTAKVLLVSYNFPPEEGGIAAHAYGISQGLSGLCDAVAVAPRTQNCEKFDAGQKFRVRRLPLPAGGLMFHVQALLQVFGVILSERPDAVYVSNWTPFGVPVALASSALGIPFSVGVHAADISAPDGSAARRRMLFVYSRARRLLAVSNYTASRLAASGLPRKKIAVVGNGVDFGRFSVADRKSEAALRKKFRTRGRKVLLTVCPLDYEYKNIDLALRATALAAKKFPKILHIIAGRGRLLPELQELARGLGIGKNVLFAGYVPESELPSLFRICDVFVLPSGIPGTDNVEGFGIVFLEAAAAGKPSVALDAGGVRDAIIGGETGILIKRRSEGELAAAIVRLLSEPALARRLGCSAKRRAKSEFGWDKISGRVFSEVLS